MRGGKAIGEENNKVRPQNWKTAKEEPMKELTEKYIAHTYQFLVRITSESTEYRLSGKQSKICEEAGWNQTVDSLKEGLRRLDVLPDDEKGVCFSHYSSSNCRKMDLKK